MVELQAMDIGIGKVFCSDENDFIKQNANFCDTFKAPGLLGSLGEVNLISLHSAHVVQYSVITY